MNKVLFQQTALLFFLCLHSAVQAGTHGESVEYVSDDITLKGYLAYNEDKTDEKSPGVLVVHEWWGHNAYARKRADMLAEMGYVALAVDMYGEGKQASHPDKASDFVKEVTENWETARARFLAGLNFLQEQPQTDPEKTAAIGYCFGGGVVLEMARQGVELDGVASFHGSLKPAVEPAKEGQVKAKIIVFHGQDDAMVTQEQVKAFSEEMKKAGASYEVIEYPGVKHSFTNLDADYYARKFKLPLQYDAQADKDSWEKLGVFLNKLFPSDKKDVEKSGNEKDAEKSGKE